MGRGAARAVLLRACVLGTLSGAAACASAPRHAEAPAPVRVVYHVDAGIGQATEALRNIRNQLEADPDTRIVVVAIGKGVDFLVGGAMTDGGYPFDLSIQELQAQGVRFEACGNTLRTRGIDPKQLAEGVVVVPAGMAEIARLEAREGYAYIKP